jgi:hypothetical protein
MNFSIGQHVVDKHSQSRVVWTIKSISNDKCVLMCQPFGSDIKPVAKLISETASATQKEIAKAVAGRLKGPKEKLESIEDVMEFFENRVQYKPGWQISTRHSYTLDQIEIVVSAPKTESPTNEEISIRGHYIFNPNWTKERCTGIAESLIRSVEKALQDKWLKIDSKELA